MPWSNKPKTVVGKVKKKVRGDARCTRVGCHTILLANGTCPNCRRLADNPPAPAKAQAQPTRCGCGGWLRGENQICSKNPCPRGN